MKTDHTRWMHPNRGLTFVISLTLLLVILLLAIAGQAQASQPNESSPSAPGVANNAVYIPLIAGDSSVANEKRRTNTPSATRTTAPTLSFTPTRTRTITPVLSSTPTRTNTPLPSTTLTPSVGAGYIVLGWNDLGMHCYNRSFQDVAILPPYNNLFVQVIKRGNPPKIVTSGIRVEYSFPNNTYSVGKSNFWTYAQQLFGVTLAPNIGLTGKGLAGNMDANVDHFTAMGIPLTEFNDSDWNAPVPYQLANIVAKDSTGTTLASNQVVAPVSTEMHCDYCHGDGAFGITTGRVETNILTLHDKKEGNNYPAGHAGPLMNRRPILCAECHATNALGAPGVAGVPNLSKAMHTKHEGKVPDSTDGCYNCHPGPSTKCLRDVMSSGGMGCVDCHGGMNTVKQNPQPWLNEPRCDTCHTDPKYRQDKALYRESKGHGGIYCEGCHDSTHAIATSTQPEDAIKFINLQGHAGTLDKCTVCHLTQPSSGGPHQ